MALSPDTTRPASRFTLDWMLVAIAVIAVLVVLGSVLRIHQGRPDHPAPPASGLHILSPGERLVVFEDYSYGPGGWEGAPVDRGDPSAGAVLRPDPTDDLVRRFDLPAAATRVILSFEILGDAADLGIDIETEPAARRVEHAALASGRTRVTLLVTDASDSIALHLRPQSAAPWALDNLVVTALTQP